MYKFIAFLLSLFLASFILSGTVQAVEYSANQNVYLAEDEFIDGDYFAAGEMVQIDGTINGDLYAAGNQVIINGQVNGDILAAGGQVTISGNVTQDVRVAGGHIQVDGTIQRNMTAAGGFINILEQAQLLGNLVLAAGNVNINAPVAGDITAGVGSLVISDTVSGSVNATVGTLNLIDQAQIYGDLKYTSENEYSQSPGASVSGSVTRLDPKHITPVDQTQIEQTAQKIQDSASTITSFFRLVSLFTQIVIGLLLVNLVPNYSLRAVDFIEKEWFKTFLVGLVTLIVAPVIAGLLLITVIGVPLGIITFICYFLMLYFAQIFFAYWLGSRLLSGLNRKGNKTITYLIGICTFYVLASITFVGVIVNILAILFGTGALVLAKQKTYKSGRKLKIF